MYERMTEDAKGVLANAGEIARGLRHSSIGPEHLLLAILDGPGGEVLEGVDVDSLRTRIRDAIGEGESVPEGSLPYTSAAKTVMEYSLRESLAEGVDHIDTNHQLLAIIRHEDGIAWSTLTEAGVTRVSIVKT